MVEFLRFRPLGWTSDVVNLSIYEQSLSPGQAIVGDSQTTVGRSWAQIWQISPEGMLVCGADPRYVIGLSGSEPVLREIDASDPTQYWSFERGSGTAASGQSATGLWISNKSNGQYLNVPGTYTGGSAAVNLVASSDPAGTITLLWHASVSPQMFGYLQTALSGGANAITPYVLEVSSDAAGTAAVINPMSPGTLGQLWSFLPDYVIYSALNSAMVLQAGGDDTAVTLQKIVTGLTADQQWERAADGRIAVLNITPPNTAPKPNQYLNVQGGGLAKNQPVITYGPQTGALNDVWYFVTPPKQGFWFCIGSACDSPDDVPYYLTAYQPDGGLYAVAGLGHDILPAGQPASNQLWRMTLDGQICCAICPQLVLTGAADGSVQLAPPSTGGVGQIWAWGAGAEVENTVAGKKVKIPQGVLYCVGLGTSANVLALRNPLGLYNNPASLLALQTDSGGSPGGYPQQLWYVQPSLPGYDQWTTIRSGLSTTTADLVLNVDKDAITPGTPVITYPIEANQPNSIWQFTSSGQIVSAVDSQAALSVQPGTDNVVIYPVQPGEPRFQQWRAGVDGVIYSLANGKVLTAAPDEGNVTVAALVRDKDGAPQASQAWEFSPGALLSTIVAQPAVPFPGTKGTPDAAAYQAINTALGLTAGTNGLRMQYTNLAAPLAGYLGRLSLLACPSTSSFTPSDWNAAVLQLSEELTAAIAVQALFQQLNNLHLALSQMQSLTLNEMILLVGLSNHSTLPAAKRRRNWIYDIAMGVVYTALNAAGSFVGDPEAGEELSMGAKFVKNGLPVIANLLQAGFSASQAATEDQSSTLTIKEEVVTTVAQLQESLIQLNQQASQSLAKMETLILSDWGKLQAVHTLIGRPAGVNSLFWPASVTPMLVNQMMPGFIIGVLQALIPSDSNNTITRESQMTGTASAGRQSATTYNVLNSDGTHTNFSTNVDETVMNTVWANGGTPFSFFHAQDGWSAMPLYENSKGQWPSGGTFMVCFIQNFTPEVLSVNASCGGSQAKGQMCGTVNPQTLPAYGVINFGAANSGSTGDPVDSGTVVVTQSDGTNVLNGTFAAAGTSHDWSCSITSANGGAGYTVFNQFISKVSSGPSSVVDDMVMWNIQIYWNPPPASS
jgi:hypothetical protein